MKYSHPTEIPLSKDLFFDWIGERISLSNPLQAGDTYPQTWADDDEIYVGAGDPGWFEKDGEYSHFTIRPVSEETLPFMSGQVVEKFTGDPENFVLHRVHDMPGYIGYGGSGPKPCGMICVNGVLYYAVQNLLGSKTPPHRAKSQHGSDATIICSKDHGETWEPDLNDFLKKLYQENFVNNVPEEERTGYQGWKPMFPGAEFGGLSFVQYGKNNETALDDYIYAISGDQWDNGRYIRLGRVLNTCIMDRDKWEFASLDTSGNPIWHKDISESSPILDIEGHIGLPEMVYIPTLKKYILLTWNLHTDFSTPTGSSLTILESDNIWGPFSLVHYEWMWDKREVCAYTPRIPLKWFDEKSLEGYILYSGNWGEFTADGNWVNGYIYYKPHVKKFRFSRRKK